MIKTVSDLLRVIHNNHSCDLRILSEDGKEIELLDLPISYNGDKHEITLIARING